MNMRRWFASHRRWRAVTVVAGADEIKRPLPRRRIMLVGSKAAPKWAIFECPCGTGHEIMLNLDRRRRPAWQMRSSFIRGATVQPSVDSIQDHLRCHYFIRRGRVKWTKEQR